MTNHVINMSWARDKEKNLSPDRNNRSEFLSENISQAMLNLYMYWFWLFYYIYIYIYINIGSRKKTTLSSRQACFVSLNIYITLYLNVSSTVLRKNRNTDFLYIYIHSFSKRLTFLCFLCFFGLGSWLFCRFPFFFFCFQFNRQSRNKIMSLYTDSMSAQIGITTMFAILVAADLVGNTIVCLIIIVFHDMR